MGVYSHTTFRFLVYAFYVKIAGRTTLISILIFSAKMKRLGLISRCNDSYAFAGVGLKNSI